MSVGEPTAEEVCINRRNPQRQKEMWRWNDEVAKAVTNIRLLLKTLQKSRTNQDRGTQQACKKVIANAKRTKSQKLAGEVNSHEGRRNVCYIVKNLQRLAKT